ncbi:thermonuclease family protein [Phaeovulum vinaykumarii]|uniref:Endonuclease YncB, thermonuclease family n=1 Tax=Phaeovulum vinaykumarii TaxID=407234 RepID=A0A1N7L1C1_9RHOB|nr:thermonuclease family protein [Phaeovulum vinaykumarii]SIS67617.1 Endonuclease YncB, thermonuclease family [Phaeovulum vinaykumarii]SOC00648.1 endonuclease YncB(thermonuclease family) [Phaeovulum vinaykumarii]
MLRVFLLLLFLSPGAALAGPSGVPRVIDGDTIELSGTRIRLFGIDAPEGAQRCRDAAGRTWDCGRAATAALRQLSARGLRCEGRDRDRYDRLVARCRTATGQDVGAALVESGAAFAYARYSRAYLGAEARARAARRGVWAGPALRPEAFRRGDRLAATPAAASNSAPAPASVSGGNGCTIKGNISARGRIYHLPGTRAYAATRIDTARGERWFCSERAARAAGWRPPRHP